MSGHADINTTRDGVIVTVGQQWRNCDPRMNGQVKTVILVLLHGYVVMAPSSGLRRSRVRIDRMHKCSTGWELVK